MRTPLLPQRPRGLASTTLLLFAGLAGLVAWASLFDIDQAVRAQGQVIPIARTQVIQAADGSVLDKLLVQEGQAVKAGQQLAVLERERPTAGFEESRARSAALEAALERARAEAEQRAPQFSPALRAYPDFVAVQQALYKQGLLGLR